MAENRKLLVVDASVILKWFLKEENWMEQAWRLRGHHVSKKINIIVPSHCFFELANILKRKIPNEAMLLISKLKFSEIMEQILSIRVISIAFQLMDEHKKISFYDAAYHALALAEGGTFVTADEDYYKIAKKSGNIMLLKNYC